MNSNIKSLLKIVFIVSFISVSGITLGQDVDAHSPKPAAGGHLQQKADKKKAKKQAEIQKGIEQGKKQHEKMQARNTKKMMKKSKRTSKHWNENKKEFFLKRWFQKKHH